MYSSTSLSRSNYPYSYYRRIPYSAEYNMNPTTETTVAKLINAISQTRTTYKPNRFHSVLSRSDFADQDLYGVDCDEVYPNIFIGDGLTAKNTAFLTKLGITHILNTAEGNAPCMVNTSKQFYQGTRFKYLGLQLTDLPSTRISVHFNETSNFIDDALRYGKVYVHCLMGMSRSSTCVIAYLMMKKGMTAEEAIRQIREHRNIYPNEGFLEQLAELDNYLRRKRCTT